jgi:hypothetical protein
MLVDSGYEHSAHMARCHHCPFIIAGDPKKVINNGCQMLWFPNTKAAMYLIFTITMFI